MRSSGLTKRSTNCANSTDTGLIGLLTEVNVLNEQRKSPRRVVKAKAVLAIEGMAPMQARTIDVAANGVAVACAHHVPVGAVGKLSFDLYFDGKTTPIKALARALYCIISNGEYKIGFQFVSVDLTSLTMLSKFLR